jgi:hypothetical protein
MQFISEPIEPEAGSFSTGLMARGLASLPGAFTWRNRRYEIVECLSHAKVSAPEGGTSDGERYLRRQEFTVTLDSGQIARLYVQRQAGRGASSSSARRRWFLFTLDDGPAKSAARCCPVHSALRYFPREFSPDHSRRDLE